MMKAFTLLAATTLCSQFALGSAADNHSVNVVASGTNQLRGLKKAAAQRALPSVFTTVNDACVAGTDTWHFIYKFTDDCILQGYTTTPDLTLKYCDGSTIKLDISCSTNPYDKDGFSTKAGYGPSKGNAAVAKYTIKSLQSGTCECAQYCAYGTTTMDQQMTAVETVKKNLHGRNGQVSLQVQL